MPLSNKTVVDMIITADAVVTMDEKDRILRPGAVAIRDDRIVGVGTPNAIKEEFESSKVLGGRHTLVMPGLVDAYAHAGHGMIKGIYTAELGWPASKVYFHGSTPEWWEADALLTGLDRLRFGVTTGHSTLGATPARADDAAYSEAHVRGVSQVGTRDILGIGPGDPFLMRSDKSSTATDWRGDTPKEVRFTYDDCMHVSAEVVSRFDGASDGRVTVCLAIPYLCGMNPKYTTGSHSYSYSQDEMREMARRGVEAQEFAARYGVLIHTHAARGSFEMVESRLGALQVDAMLQENVLIAHGHGLTAFDMDVLERNGPSVAWVPFGSWGTRVGPAPVVDLIRRGIRCCIATDGAAPFHNSDLFLDIHRAMFLIAENYGGDASLLPPGKALRMVTVDAAAALGMADDIGSLEVGKKADLIILDTDKPYFIPLEAVPQLLCYFARGNDVETVIVDGNILMEDGQVLSVDEHAVKDFAREEAERSFERVDITPYLATPESFWRGWRH